MAYDPDCVPSRGGKPRTESPVHPGAGRCGVEAARVLRSETDGRFEVLPVLW